MKNFIMLITFALGIFLYGGDELFPFGINHTVYGEFATDAPPGYCAKYERTLDSAATLGIKWWRAMKKFTWLSVQPDEFENYDWSDEDSLVKWTGERDMNILPVIGYMYPYWARHPEIPDTDTVACMRYPFDPNNWGKYMKFTQAMAERYDGDGEPYIDTVSGDTVVKEPEWLKIPINYWECMNEPYDPNFLGDFGQYAEIFDSTRLALKRANPNAKLGGPCLNSRLDSTTWFYYDVSKKTLKYDKYEWLSLLEDILNDIDTYDFITHHIYHYSSDGPELTMDDIHAIRTIDSIRPLWITECGYQWYQYWHQYPSPPDYPDTNFDRSWYFYEDYYGAPSGGRRDTIWVADSIATILWVDTVGDYKRSDPTFYWRKETQAEVYNVLLDSLNDLLDEESNYKFFFFHILANTLGIKTEFDNILDSSVSCTDTSKPCTLWVKNFQVQDPLWDDPHLSAQLSIIRNSFKPLPAYDTIRNSILLPGDEILSNITVNTGKTKTYQAMDSIRASDFTINNGGKVAMEAGLQIYLGDGFRVQEGGYFYGATNPLYGGGGGGMSSSKMSKPQTIKPLPKDEQTDSIPKAFSCSQNYPNPFAQSTIIKYGLPKDVDVQLDIYNLIGQKVHTLVNAKQSAGYKSISWDGKTSKGTLAPRGIYFYTFKAGDFEKHHKMILLK
jgi:hypothetical protein